MRATDLMDRALWLLAYPHAALFQARARKVDALLAGDATRLREAELDEALAMEAVVYRRLRDTQGSQGTAPKA